MRHLFTGIKRLAKALVALLLVMAIGFVAGRYVARISQGAGIGTDATSAFKPSEPSEASAPTYHTWDKDQDSNYYRVLGRAVIDSRPEAGTVAYGEPDELGRTTGAIALVTHESMVAGIERERGDTSSIRPSGWGHNREVAIPMPDGTVYHGFLYNRSHLVAKSLGGDDEAHNLIAGTRTQNVGANVDGTDGGMAYCEGLARAWLTRHHSGQVYYAATPVYEGDELVARSVIVDIKSSDGSLDQRIEVFNAARGFEIDYATGEFWQTEDAEEAAAEIRTSLGLAPDTKGAPTDGQAEAGVEPTGSPEPENGERKVIVTGSGKAYHHDETCSGLEHARSMEWVTVSEAEAMGRHPCSICGG